MTAHTPRSKSAAQKRLTADNIKGTFDEWQDSIFVKKIYDPIEKIQFFIKCMTDLKSVKIKNDSEIELGGDTREVCVTAFNALKARFSHSAYSDDERSSFNAMRDQLIEDDKRRFQGAFYTESEWVNIAHQYVSDVLGGAWYDECIWDCAAGTGNLFRGFHAKNLILSTAERADVEAMKRERQDADVFQYDFLNEGKPTSKPSDFFERTEDNQIPKSVQDRLRLCAAEGKRLIFFMNPPYAAAGNRKNLTSKGDTSNKEGVGNTDVNSLMTDLGFGTASSQLYAQFIFRCDMIAKEYGFKDCSIAVFCKPSFCNLRSYAKFRSWLFNLYEYKRGFLFQASQFADVSEAWGISFTIWNTGRTDASSPIIMDLKSKAADSSIHTIGQKNMSAVDESQQAHLWVREFSSQGKIDVPQMSSGLKVRQDGKCRVPRESLMYFTHKANSPMYAAQETYLVSSACSANYGCAVLAGESWKRSIAYFAARRLTEPSWINDKDEYRVPLTEHKNYNTWLADCHVFALLNSANNCASLRRVEYKDAIHTINNNFFWKKKADVARLAVNSEIVSLDCLDVLSQQIEQEDMFVKTAAYEPYFAQILPTLALSPLAREIMSDLDVLFEKSLALRDSLHADQPDLHLNAWDAGIYQLKTLWDLHFKEEWTLLKKKNKDLSSVLKHGVQTFGFLI